MSAFSRGYYDPNHPGWSPPKRIEPSVAPEGYKRLPDGVQCKCIRSFKAADGSFWCCVPDRNAHAGDKT